VIAQVWSVNGQEKVLIPAADQSKFYSGGCYIFQYSYPGEDREEYLIGTWFGKKSVKVNFRHPILTCPPISF
jgi:gelsolin